MKAVVLFPVAVAALADPAPALTTETAQVTQTRTALGQPEYSTISSVLDAITSDVASLDAGVKSFTGPVDTKSLEGLSQDVLNTIDDGIDIITPLQPLNLEDSADLIYPVNDLTVAVNDTVVNLVAKKQLFIDSCGGPTILKAIDDQLDATDEFSQDLINHIGLDLQNVGVMLANSILDILSSGSSVFADQTTLPASCSSASTTASASATSSASKTSMISSSGNWTSSGVPRTSSTSMTTTSCSSSPAITPTQTTTSSSGGSGSSESSGGSGGSGGSGTSSSSGSSESGTVTTGGAALVVLPSLVIPLFAAAVYLVL